jgi:hypothetical protein
LDYDQRRRGTAVETDIESARHTMADLKEKLVDSDAAPARAVSVRTLPAPGRSPVLTRSTFDRELAFVLSHTIHHSAMIAVMIGLMGASVSSRLGLAPATLALQSACAQ